MFQCIIMIMVSVFPYSHKVSSLILALNVCSFLCAFSDAFLDWKQNANEVIVRLRCGEGVQRIDDVNTTFTDTHCHVCFPGKRN